MIVDDEQGFTRLVRFCLEQTGRYEVHEVNRGTLAMAAVRTVRPDLILLDILMPDVHGDRIAERLKDDPQLRHIPVIFLTAIVSKDDLGAQTKIVGGQPFITKPVSMDLLMACIEEQVGHHMPAAGR